MKTLTISFQLTDDMHLTSAIIITNETGIDDPKELLSGLANAIITDNEMEKIKENVNKIINNK
jgi:hypothetical protein